MTRKALQEMKNTEITFTTTEELLRILKGGQ